MFAGAGRIAAIVRCACEELAEPGVAPLGGRTAQDLRVQVG